MIDFSRARNFAALACAVAALTFLLGVTLVTPIYAQRTAAERAQSLDNRIMCMCGGCNDAAAKCNHMGGAFSGPCATAQKEMAEVAQRTKTGQSDDLILQSFVQEYGPTVLISPPARGFDLWAWLMPIIACLIGIALVALVVVRWRRRVVLAPASPVSPELLSRARRELSGDLDD